MEREYLIRVWRTVDNSAYRNAHSNSLVHRAYYPDYSHVLRQKLVEGEKARDRYLKSMRKKWAGPDTFFQVVEREVAPWVIREVSS